MIFATTICGLLLCGCPLISAQSFLEVISNDTDLSNVRAVLGANPDFVTTIDNSQNFTFLAPIDSAFNGIKTSVNSNLTRALLSYHCLNGTVSNYGTLQMIHTLLDDPEFANVTGGQVVGAVGYMDQAYFFSGLSRNSTAIGSPLNFTGGRIYKVDSVLTIPMNVTSTINATGMSTAQNFFNASGLTDFVDTSADTMVLVPSESAFQDISSVFNSDPLGINITRLAQYHMSDTELIYQTLSTQFEVPTIAGVNVTVRQVSAAIFVNNAKVVVADILTSNGVIQVIDQLINPENTTLLSRSSSDSGAIAFADAYNDGRTPFVSTNTSTTETEPSSKHSSTNTGAIVGGIIGGIACLAFIAVAIWFLVRRTGKKLAAAKAARKQQKQKKAVEMPASPTDTSTELRADSRQPVELLQNERAELSSEEPLYAELPGSSPVLVELDSSFATGSLKKDVKHIDSIDEK